MPMWRCPHCGNPQPESSRCWVCRRPTTGCATCNHFRRAVVANLGWCGRDRTRAALSGDEVRPCWEPRDRRTTLRSAGPGDALRPALPMAAPLWLDETPGS